MKTTHVAFCIDESGSVAGIVRSLIDSYNKNVVGIRQSVMDEGQNATMTAFAFGHTKFGHRLLYSGVQVQTVKPLGPNDIKPSGMTPLFDSVYRAAKELKRLDDGNPDTTFIVTTITDGEENNSHNPGIKAAIDEMTYLTLTDRWTFTFMVPRGKARDFACRYGIPEGNVMEWEATTPHGTETGFAQNTSAYTGYFKARSVGMTSTAKFYADIAKVDIKDIKAQAKDISSELIILDVNTKIDTAGLAASMGITYEKGKFFYQLTKTEPKVQDYKMILIRDTVSKHVYGGDSARAILGLPTSGTVKVAPGRSGQYEIFIQSTAPNRTIHAGTKVIYWKNATVNK